MVEFSRVLHLALYYNRHLEYGKVGIRSRRVRRVLGPFGTRFCPLFRGLSSNMPCLSYGLASQTRWSCSLFRRDRITSPRPLNGSGVYPLRSARASLHGQQESMRMDSSSGIAGLHDNSKSRCNNSNNVCLFSEFPMEDPRLLS